MEREFYTVEQISNLLNIHPKTIQRYIREGKLHATKIGKSWRVSGHDLSCFTEQNTDYSTISATPNENRIRSSAVVDISDIGREEATRISNSLTAAMNVKPAEYGQASLHTQFLEGDNILRITVWGNLKFTSGILSFVEMYTDQAKQR